MALTKTIALTNDVSVSVGGVSIQTTASASAAAYIKVERVDSNKSSAIAYVSYSGDTVSGNETFEFEPNLELHKNFIAQAYEHLKTLPEFAGAQDC